MVSEVENETLCKVLNKLELNEIPPLISEDEERIWAVGVGKVRKCDFSTNYAIVCNDGRNKPFVKQDFGKMAQIVEILEVRPSVYLDSETMPNLRRQSDILKYLRERDYDTNHVAELLSSKGKEEKQVEKDRAEVMAMVIQCAVDDILSI